MLTKAQLKALRKIEAAAYPKHMQYMQDIRSWVDVQEYCESETVAVLLKDHFYCLATEVEVVDLASSSKLSIADSLEVVSFLQETFESRPFTLDARETTSYRLLKMLEKRGRLAILSDEPWDWDGIAMHEMTVQFLI